MPKLTVNDIQGFAYFQARDHIGISISKVCEMTGLNRNKLSQFEQEKGALAANEKRTLKRFYEERGYDFENVEPIDGNAIKSEYEANKAEVSESIDSLMPNETGESLISYIDSVHDVLTANGYLDDLTYQPVKNGNAPKMPEAYETLADELWKHFEADKRGEFKDEGGLFGGSASERGKKLTGLLAYQQLQLMQSQRPDLIVLSFEKATKQTDNRRLLEELIELLGQTKPKAFNHINAETIK